MMFSIEIVCDSVLRTQCSAAWDPTLAGVNGMNLACRP